MNEKGFNFAVFRRIITIILLAGISVTFLAVYYLIYLPEQRALFNAETFRILHDISVNFHERIQNYDTSQTYSYKSVTWKDEKTSVKKLDLLDSPLNSLDTARFNKLFKETFGKGISKMNSFTATEVIKGDSVHYTIDTVCEKSCKENPVHILVKSKALSEIIDPLTNVHSGTFKSIFLIKQIDSFDSNNKRTHYDPVLYKPAESEIDIANINTDSLFPDKNFQVPVVRNVDIEDVPYKIFLLPFRMEASTFVLAGIMQRDTYDQQVQNIPIDFLLTILLILVAILLALPFLKIFLLGKDESLHLTDVRAIIAVIFIFPFLLVLLYSAAWTYWYHHKFVDDVLVSLQKNITHNFYTEISHCIQQEKDYNNVIQHPSDSLKNVEYVKKNADTSADIKDIIFHPNQYIGFTNVHWMDQMGRDIAVWNFVKFPPNATYFNVSDREYFRNIKYKKLSLLPGDSTDSFAIEAYLSRLTGEYSISVATGSDVEINSNRTAKVVGISSKMYSVYNVVIPNGFAFCIIDSSGKVICHSDTAKNLQENIFKESGNNYLLSNAVRHKDSVEISDIVLYDRPVRLMVKPIKGLPYYIITYYWNRGENLFIFHITSFAFVCEVVLLLFTCLFSYFAMLSTRRVTTLNFEPFKLNWLKPTPEKKNYYANNGIYFLTIFIAYCSFAACYLNGGFYLFVLNAAILLPLLSVTGYYLVKRSKIFIDANALKGSFLFTKNHGRFLLASKDILALFILSLAIFYSVQNVLLYNGVFEYEGQVKAGVAIFVMVALASACIIPVINAEIRFVPNYLMRFIISTMLGVILTSVVPEFAFMSYGFHEERRLELQSLQFDLAKKVQERRQTINQRLWQTKLNINNFNDSIFINSLKFSRKMGIYLLPQDTLIVKDTLHKPMNLSGSPFYKIVTQILFLPHDHDEFYDNSTHNDYYHWTIVDTGGDSRSLKLYFNNATDFKNSSSFSLMSRFPRVYLLKGALQNKTIIFLLLTIILITLLGRLLRSTAKRVFLIHFFNNDDPAAYKGESFGDKRWLEGIYIYLNLNEIKKFIGLDDSGSFSFKLLRQRENEMVNDVDKFEEFVLQGHILLKDVFGNIWNKCTDAEKFALYDFASDGFTNYRNVLTLYELYNKGLLVKESGHGCGGNEDIGLISMSFHNFLITKEGDPTIKQLSSHQRQSSWWTLKTAFYTALIAFAVFILITQQEATQRLMTIVSSLGILIPAIIKLFGTGITTGKPDGSKADG